MTQLALFPPTRTRTPLMVRDLPQRERPEYRLQHTGAAALSDAELVQLVGRFKQVDSANQLLVNAESLGRLAQMSVDELIALPRGRTHHSGRFCWRRWSWVSACWQPMTAKRSPSAPPRTRLICCCPRCSTWSRNIWSP